MNGKSSQEGPGVALSVWAPQNKIRIDSRRSHLYRHLMVPLVHAHRLAAFAIAIMTFTLKTNLGHSRIADSYALRGLNRDQFLDDVYFDLAQFASVAVSLFLVYRYFKKEHPAFWRQLDVRYQTVLRDSAFLTLYLLSSLLTHCLRCQLCCCSMYFVRAFYYASFDIGCAGGGRFGILAPHLGTCAGQRGCAGRAGFTHPRLGFKLSAATVLGIEQYSSC